MRVQQDVRNALLDGRPVVLLETAVLTHGLPQEPWPATFGAPPAGIDHSLSIHVATMRAMDKAVRDGGATPAITAIIDGIPHIGLNDVQLDTLASDATATKAAAATIGQAIAMGSSAGTTVSGTLRLAAAVEASGLPMPRVFATGGIGGVHFGWQQCPDISADLGELSRQQVCLVCAGAKSIIDPVATTEALETLGIPVLGLGTNRLPRFQAPGDASCPPVTEVASGQDIAAIAAAHWTLPGSGGLLIVQPPPASEAMTLKAVEQAVEHAEDQVTETGQARTPALLGAMATMTAGATLRANIALLVANAMAAAGLAGHLAQD